MRSFAFFFSFYLIMLAIYPGIAAYLRGGKAICHSAACSNTQGSRPEGNKKEFPSDLRTPLFMCPAIQIATHQISEIHFGIDVAKIEFGSFNQQYGSVNPVAPWHPPRLILSA